MKCTDDDLTEYYAKQARELEAEALNAVAFSDADERSIDDIENYLGRPIPSAKREAYFRSMETTS